MGIGDGDGDGPGDEWEVRVGVLFVEGRFH